MTNAKEIYERLKKQVDNHPDPSVKQAVLPILEAAKRAMDGSKTSENRELELLKLKAKAPKVKLSMLDLDSLDGLAGTAQRFSKVKEIPRANITVRPDLFQGREHAFSTETVEKILQEGFDKSQEPIAVWYDAETKKYVVISGHSRWEASKRLHELGDTSLANMPVKEFLGDMEDAIEYALLESNRSGTKEGLKSDVKAYQLAKKKGCNRKLLGSRKPQIECLKRFFKTEGHIRLLEDLSYLNPKGRFFEYLDTDSETSFPYLKRNAQWVGTLRNLHMSLSDSHEREIFDYLYGSRKGLSIKKDQLFDLIEKKVGTIDFDPTKPLNLYNIASSSPLTDPLKAEIREVEKEIERLNNERQRKESLIIQARKEGKDHLAAKFQAETSDLNTLILRKLAEKDKLEANMKTVERQSIYDLFNPAPTASEKPSTKDKALALLKLKAKAVRVRLKLEG